MNPCGAKHCAEGVVGLGYIWKSSLYARNPSVTCTKNPADKIYLISFLGSARIAFPGTGGRKKSGGRGGFGAQRANLSAGLDFEIGLPGLPVHVALMSLVIIVLDGEHSGADEVRFPDPLFATFKFFDTC